MALRARDVDYAIGVDANWLKEIIKGKEINKPFLYKKDDLYVLPTIGAGTNFIHLNCHDQMDTPFKDVRVRQALDYAIDQVYLLTYMKTIGASAWSTKLKGFKPLDYFYPTQALAETWLES